MLNTKVPRSVLVALPLASAVVGALMFVNRQSASDQPEAAPQLKGPEKAVTSREFAARPLRPAALPDVAAASVGETSPLVNDGGRSSAARPSAGPLPPDALELLLAASRGFSLGVRSLAFGSGDCVTCAVESGSSFSFDDVDASWVRPALWSVEPTSGYGAFVAEVPMQGGRLAGPRGLAELPGRVADNGGATGPSLPGVSTSDSEYSSTPHEPATPIGGGDVVPPDADPKHAAVPEPATILITGIGLAALIVERRRQRHRSAVESRLRAEGFIK